MCVDIDASSKNLLNGAACWNSSPALSSPLFADTEYFLLFFSCPVNAVCSRRDLPQMEPADWTVFSSSRQNYSCCRIRSKTLMQRCCFCETAEINEAELLVGAAVVKKKKKPRFHCRNNLLFCVEAADWWNTLAADGCARCAGLFQQSRTSERVQGLPTIVQSWFASPSGT